MSFTKSPTLRASILAVIGLISCISASGASTTLTGVVRDFYYAGTSGTLAGSLDFENAIGDDRGLVATTLGADGTPVYLPSGSTSTTHGAALFNQWYHDTPGVNLSTNYAITLNETFAGSGVYSYSSNAFFPIDNLLGGNQGSPHNYAFTYQIHTNFTYQTGQSFNFAGDDDVWVFINKKLVIDLGGVHGSESASVNLDTLGLSVGGLYDFDFFFAERHQSGSNLTITTSIPLVTNPVPEIGSVLGYLLPAGLLLLVAGRKRFVR
ncbi:MAG: fibro-slime domain-containing protein [Verrucomicrobia bacterium]|nr:fibro-slime domain-containing protein [Verrucomicrobiota bacterium]